MDVKYSKWTGNGFDLLNNSQDNKISLLYQIYPRVSYTVVAKNGSTKEPLFIAECKINEDNVGKLIFLFGHLLCSSLKIAKLNFSFIFYA